MNLPLSILKLDLSFLIILSYYFLFKFYLSRVFYVFCFIINKFYILLYYMYYDIDNKIRFKLYYKSFFFSIILF